MVNQVLREQAATAEDASSDAHLAKGYVNNEAMAKWRERNPGLLPEVEVDGMVLVFLPNSVF
jgi:hypothetical protein